MAQVIFSDVHGDLDALRAVLAQPHEDRVSLGDIVDNGRGAIESDCLDLLREYDVKAIQGNHERNVSFRFDIHDERGAISPENLDYLSQLPDRITEGNTLYVHEGVTRFSSGDGRRIFGKTEAIEEFSCVHREFPSINIVFFGHSHVPLFVRQQLADRSVEQLLFREEMQLDAEHKYLICPGSIRLPRTTIPSYCLFDQATQVVQLKTL